MKKRYFSLVLLCLLANPVFSQGDSAGKQGGIPFIVGFSCVPSNAWGAVSIIGQKQLLKYDFDASTLTTWEGTFSAKRLPLKLGINLQFENNIVGKLYKYAGYLGFKNTYIRFQTGKISGRADWTGGAIPGTSPEFSFNHQYTNIDMLVYLFKILSGTGYIGLGYTSLDAPVQVNTLKTATDQANQEYAVPVFDKALSIKSYSFLFGFDDLRSEAIRDRSHAGINSPGFGFFVASQDRLGFGMCRLSKESILNAEAVNPGLKSVGGDLFSALVEFEGSMGLKWSADIGPGRLIVGAGYEISGAMAANFSGAATNPTELGFDPGLFYFRHGVVLRAFFSW